MSLFRDVYFVLFLMFAARIFLSKLQVNSNTYTDLMLLFIITRSGLDRVTSMSGGIVLPFKLRSGKSAYTSMLSGLFSMITLLNGSTQSHGGSYIFSVLKLLDKSLKCVQVFLCYCKGGISTQPFSPTFSNCQERGGCW